MVYLNSLVPAKMDSYRKCFSIKVDEQVITKEQVIADNFNEILVNIASNLKQPLKPSNFEKLNNFINSKVTDDVSFDIPLISCTFVTSFLSSMDGTRLHRPQSVKIGSTVLSPGITFIINKSVASGVFPSIWKHAKVKPLYKSGAKNELNNYSPISILTTLSKIMNRGFI